MYELWGKTMRKKLGILLSLLMIFVALSACVSDNSNQVEETKEQPSFSAIEDMEEITVEGNRVTVALLQDIPLPYRWAVTWQSECATLMEEYEVEDPANGSVFSAGSAPEYHVFVFELAESDMAQLEFYNQWVVEPENLAEANGKRNYILEYADGQWKVVSAESSN